MSNRSIFFVMRYRGPLTLVIFLVALLAPSSLPAQPIASEAQAPRYLRHDDRDFAAYVNEKTGTPYWILDVDSLDFTLGLNQSLTSEASVSDAASAFLATYAETFGIDSAELALERITTDGDLWFISFRQVHKGLPVLGGTTGITVNRSGCLVAVGVQAFPNLQIKTQPQLSVSAAIQVARARAVRPDAQSSAEETLFILPVERAEHYDFKLAWQLRLDDLKDTEPYSTTFLIDAETGEVLAEYNNILVSTSHEKREWPGVSGADITSGTPRSFSFAEPSAFRTHLPAPDADYEPHSRRSFQTPMPSSNSIYGYVTLNYYESPDDPYDALVRHTDVPFSHTRVRVERDSDGWTDETFANASGYYLISVPSSGAYTVTFELENTHAYIASGLSSSEESESVGLNVSGATQCDYDWGWGDGGDLPNSSNTARALTAVYSIRQMYDYVKNTRGYSGMDDEPQRKINIVSSNAGSTTPWTRDIDLGGPTGQSDEVAHHEYFHNVIYDMYGENLIQWTFSGGDPFYNSAEAAAMDEAFPDYFTSSFKGDDTYGGPVRPSQGGTEPTFPYDEGVGTRFLYNSCTMDDFNGSWPCGGNAHNRSRIISGAVWRVRIAMGTGADQLAFKALQITPLPQSFLSYRARLFAADAYYNNNANRSTIEQKFVERKIGGPVPPSSLIITGDPTYGDVDLSWNDLSSVEENYVVERRLNGGAWSTRATLSPNATSHTDEDVFCRAGTNDYEYRIRVDKSGVTSTYSPIRAYDPCGPFPRVASLYDQAQPAVLELTRETILESNAPNPFNPTTTIRYALSEEGRVRLAVYDVLGREVAVLVEGTRAAGRHEATFDAAYLPSGIYVYRLETADSQFSRTMLLAK